MAPLVAIDGAKIAIFIGPFIPDRHAVVFQITDIGIARQEPQQFMDDRAQVQLFRRYQRKTIGQRIAALQAKGRNRASAGAVA